MLIFTGLLMAQLVQLLLRNTFCPLSTIESYFGCGEQMSLPAFGITFGLIGVMWFKASSLKPQGDGDRSEMTNIPLGLQISTYGLLITGFIGFPLMMIVMFSDFSLFIKFIIISSWSGSMLLQHHNLQKEKYLFVEGTST
ncbi:hypothetical protein LCGC14_2657970, partial [marine sediment metagenome]